MNISDYLALFPGASREKERFMALAEAVLQQVTDLIPVTLGALANYSFLTAEGKALDGLAAVFGLSRMDTYAGQNCTDEAFRFYLLAKLAYWTWNGSNQDAYAVYSKAGITRRQTDGLDGSIDITSEGVMPDAPFRQIIPYPAGIKWYLTMGTN